MANYGLQENNEDELSIYKGKTVHLTGTSNAIQGRIIHYDHKEGYFILLPSLMHKPDGTPYIEYEEPTIFRHGPGEIAIRPLKEGHLEATVKNAQEQKRKEERRQ